MIRIILYISVALLFLHNVEQYLRILILMYYMAEKGIEPSENDLKHCKDEVVQHIVKDLVQHGRQP